MTYSYERVVDASASAGHHFRVRDSADNRVATCYSEENAFKVTEALNYAQGLPVHWSCGHVAGGHCADCHQLLAREARKLAEQLSTATEKITELANR